MNVHKKQSAYCRKIVTFVPRFLSLILIVTAKQGAVGFLRVKNASAQGRFLRMDGFISTGIFNSFGAKKYDSFAVKRSREALNKSARAVRERFCCNLRLGSRRNTLCISRFPDRKVSAKDPLSAAVDLFRGSLDSPAIFRSKNIQKAKRVYCL